ncbi:MAG: iron-containing redox enzyme family protein [bacterium]|nr:iron-containing redox enzyme family protein [bacterium]
MDRVIFSMETVRRLVEEYRGKLTCHPINDLIARRVLPLEVIRECAAIQYVDSMLWVPMLALMKDRVESPRLQEALRANIRCETGDAGISHLTLAQSFIRSLGIPPYFGDYGVQSKLASHPVEIMNAATGLNEAQIAGWLLVAETLVPHLFALLRPAFEGFPEVDLRYLDEHIAVDADEHAQWMDAAVKEILALGGRAEEVITGVDLGGRVTLSVPDALYAKAIRMTAK